MRNFEWATPTKVIFGSKILDRLGSETRKLGTRALFLYGKNSIVANGLFSLISTQLRDSGVEFVEHSGVQPNPRISHAEEGAKKARDNGVDIIVAAGGGSVIDEAKAIAVGALNGGPLWDFYSRKSSFEKALPIIAIQTLPATSSELNGTSVMTNESSKEKLSISSSATYPKISFLDPSLTLSIPISYTAYACTDILSHLMEGYFTASADFPMQDGMVEGVCRAVFGAMDALLIDPRDFEARSTVMWAAALAWNGLLKCGVEGASIPNHMLEHPLSGIYDIAHGAGLSIVIPAWLRYMLPRVSHRIVLFGQRAMGLDRELAGLSELTAAGIVIDKLEAWYTKIRAPVRLAEAGIERLDTDACVSQALLLSQLWGVPGYSEADIREIYAMMA